MFPNSTRTTLAAAAAVFLFAAAPAHAAEPVRVSTGAAPNSFFEIFTGAGSAPSTHLLLVRVWPNPYKPNGANPDLGKPYSPSDPDSGITFDNLALDSTIKIYNQLGTIVTELSTKVKTGRIQWDVRNDRGRELTSGVYYAVISAPGSKSITKRIMVIR